MQNNGLEKIENLNQQYTKVLNHLRSPFLLLIRLFWGWQFFMTGKGKLMNLDRTTEFFSLMS